MSLVTPDAVLVEMDTAGLASRLLAIGIDLLVMGAVSAGLILLAGALGGLSGGGDVAVVVIIFAVFAFRILYPALLEARWRGRTLGKAALGLRVVTVEGAPARFRHTLVRALIGLVEIELTGGSLALVSVLLSRRNQRLGDKFAGTMVMRERSAARATEAVRFDPAPGSDAYSATLDVSNLGASEYGTVRSFLMRAPQLSAEVRDRLARQIATPLAQRMCHTPPAGMSAEVFLLNVASAVQRRRGSTPGVPGTPPAPPVGGLVDPEVEAVTVEETSGRDGGFTAPA